MPTLLIAVRSQATACALRQKMEGRWDVYTCSSPAQTQQLLKKLLPDALIVDVRLLWAPAPPHLQRPEPTPKTVLVLTDLVTDRVLQALQEAGADGVMGIPCRPDAVVSTLEHIIGSSPA